MALSAGQRAARVTRITRVSHIVRKVHIQPRRLRPANGPRIEEAVLASRSDESLRAREIARVALMDRRKDNEQWRRDWNQRSLQREWREPSRTTLAEAFARAAK